MIERFPDGIRCGYVELTEEQQKFYKERRNTRLRLDLRGKELHKIDKYDMILEVEDGLQKLWVDWQDQPDEIVVDDIVLFAKLLTGKELRRANYGNGLSSLIYFYKSKYSIDPTGGQLIPVFENV